MQFVQILLNIFNFVKTSDNSNDEVENELKCQKLGSKTSKPMLQRKVSLKYGQSSIAMAFPSTSEEMDDHSKNQEHIFPEVKIEPHPSTFNQEKNKQLGGKSKRKIRERSLTTDESDDLDDFTSTGRLFLKNRDSDNNMFVDMSSLCCSNKSKGKKNELWTTRFSDKIKREKSRSEIPPVLKKLRKKLPRDNSKTKNQEDCVTQPQNSIDWRKFLFTKNNTNELIKPVQKDSILDRLKGKFKLDSTNVKCEKQKLSRVNSFKQRVADSLKIPHKKKLELRTSSLTPEMLKVLNSLKSEADERKKFEDEELDDISSIWSDDHSLFDETNLSKNAQLYVEKMMKIMETEKTFQISSDKNTSKGIFRTKSEHYPTYRLRHFFKKVKSLDDLADTKDISFCDTDESSSQNPSSDFNKNISQTKFDTTEKNDTYESTNHSNKGWLSRRMALSRQNVSDMDHTLWSRKHGLADENCSENHIQLNHWKSMVELGISSSEDFQEELRFTKSETEIDKTGLEKYKNIVQNHMSAQNTNSSCGSFGPYTGQRFILDSGEEDSDETRL
ncbi:hypothetical protein M153_2200044171 [Pseudoloma neurophilia]|uniref:Uncharacterized protein n=1 Tax=Pseudoloma neurophilia TaxID=146866 RepID=A0A0R0M0Z0_9MICR|nr:hypothetical protein M153_2200044171 [Pseudoloma neurophilia]